ncbi:MFS transporter [Pseudonocardia sp. CA-107938]|uniref:MFS transporter n=1 Tax=Pseudonocardia sp. CA-107938 TaxID=3240021 RepID=UPI003D92F42D
MGADAATTPSHTATGEPVQPVRGAWILRFSLAWVGLFAGLFGAIQVLLPMQAETFAGAGKEGVLALVLGLGAAASLVANPVFGAISDRTTSRYGRRVPWVAAGFLGGAVGLIVLAAAGSVAVMIIGWCVVQTALNAAYAALSATIPDEVPVRQRGTAAGWSGLALIVGVGIGTGLANLDHAVAAGYLGCAVFLLLAGLPFVLARQRPATTAPPPIDWRRFLAGFWVDPRRHPDFGWAWFTRFLVNLGNSIALLYLFYFLADSVRVADPKLAVTIATGVNLAAVLVATMVAGIASDRLHRRRVFVCGGALAMSAAAVLMACWPTWSGVLVAAVLLGLGFGTYSAVDLALLTQVLPTAADRARDLGVLNIASSLPQVVAPVAAGALVTGPGGYPLLYAVAAAVGVVGAVLVYRIRSVR